MNLFAPLPEARAGEAVSVLCAVPGLRIVRIVSRGQASPPGFWYDQAETEWVLLLAGVAELRFADEHQARRLAPGDWVEIAPHRRHRVEWTDPDEPTVWLAVFHCFDKEQGDLGGGLSAFRPARGYGRNSAKHLSELKSHDST
jgi:cupin 2 domain-containing protein